jgi:hypothetical protein
MKLLLQIRRFERFLQSHVKIKLRHFKDIILRSDGDNSEGHGNIYTLIVIKCVLERDNFSIVNLQIVIKVIHTEYEKESLGVELLHGRYVLLSKLHFIPKNHIAY